MSFEQLIIKHRFSDRCFREVIVWIGSEVC